MKMFMAMALGCTVVAGCEACSPGAPNANVAINVGSGGVRTGVSVGKQCGPVHVGIGTGPYYHWGW